MKRSRIALTLIGLPLLICGTGGAVLNRVLPKEECQQADRLMRETQDLRKEADAARGTPKQPEIQAKAKEKADSAKIWTASCAGRTSSSLLFFFLLLGTAVVGFVVTGVSTIVLLKR